MIRTLLIQNGSGLSVAILAAIGMLFTGGQGVHAQPTIVTTVPTSGATGVSPTANVVFTFSEAMDTTATMAQFIDPSNPFNPPTTTSSWDASGTVLTCTPSPAFPSNKQIYWAVNGQNPAGDPLGGTPAGFFTTGTGGGGGSSGFGTNRITTFNLGKLYSYEQTSAAAPMLDTNAPFGFGATTSLASNRTATSITLTLPTAAISNLTQNFVAKESYYLVYKAPSSNALETTFPQGNYTFNVSATASNQTVLVSLPTSIVQPNAPHVANYNEAQAVSATQPFTLTWDAFSGGAAADYIDVIVSSTGSGTTVWKSPDYAAAGALNGTATSATIPAGALLANSAYDVSLGFYRGTWTSNVTYATVAYRATVTRLSLSTAGSSAPVPAVSNPAWIGNSFSFDIKTSAGQQVTIVSSTDCALPLSTWPVLLTTNSPGTSFHFSDPGAATKPASFYGVRNGP